MVQPPLLMLAQQQEHCHESWLMLSMKQQDRTDNPQG
jgi:hypothetical protein